MKASICDRCGEVAPIDTDRFRKATIPFFTRPSRLEPIDYIWDLCPNCLADLLAFMHCSHARIIGENGYKIEFGEEHNQPPNSI